MPPATDDVRSPGFGPGDSRWSAGSSAADVARSGVASRGAGAGALDDPGLVDRLAQAIHDRYLEHELGNRHIPGSRPGLRPWEELSEPLRDANRVQATGYSELLRTQNWTLGPALEADGCDRLSAEEIEELSRAEHDRWWRHKERQGYSYGPVREDSGPDRRHPSMVDWEELTEEDRDRDRDVIRNMPVVLARASLRITRLPAPDAR